MTLEQEAETIDHTDHGELVSYAEAIRRTGLTRRLWYDRLRQTSGVRVFVDGHDRRLRLIDARDIPRLIEARPAPRRETTAA